MWGICLRFSLPRVLIRWSKSSRPNEKESFDLFARCHLTLRAHIGVPWPRMEIRTGISLDMTDQLSDFILEFVRGSRFHFGVVSEAIPKLMWLFYFETQFQIACSLFGFRTSCSFVSTSLYGSYPPHPRCLDETFPFKGHIRIELRNDNFSLSIAMHFCNKLLSKNTYL